MGLEVLLPAEEATGFEKNIPFKISLEDGYNSRK
jgi:hypothetical protein